MSMQKGNVVRSRPQKYRNMVAFKNDLHDKTPKMKMINNITVSNVCEKCKNVIEWKIKYKKFKPLKSPKTCIKCLNKSVKHAYHKICVECASESKVCAKCCEGKEVIKPPPSAIEKQKLEAEMQKILLSLSERRRRTFSRYMSQVSKKGSKKDGEEDVKQEDIYKKLKALKLSDRKKSDKSFEDDEFFDDLDDLDDVDDSDEDEDDEDNNPDEVEGKEDCTNSSGETEKDCVNK